MLADGCFIIYPLLVQHLSWKALGEQSTWSVAIAIAIAILLVRFVWTKSRF